MSLRPPKHPATVPLGWLCLLHHTWDGRLNAGISTAFLYARLFGDRDTNLGGNKIFMRPPKVLVEAGVVLPSMTVGSLYGAGAETLIFVTGTSVK